MKFSKKLIISGIIFLITSGLILLGALSEEKKQINLPSKSIPEGFDLPDSLVKNLPLRLNKGINIQTPEKLPLITTSFKNINKEESINIAESLDFTEYVTEIKNRKNELKYFWSNNQNYLWITPKKSSIRYGMNQFPDNTKGKNLSDDDFKNTALDFMVNKFGLNRESIEVKSISYYKISPMREGFSRSTRDESQLFHIDLTYKDTGYPILTATPNNQILYVEILANGEIFKAEGYIIDKIETSGENYNVKNLSDIKKSLNEAHLIYIENDYIILNNFNAERIKNIEIRKAEIGYYFDDINMNTNLQPIFLLEGEIEIEDSAADWAKLYMPALK